MCLLYYFGRSLHCTLWFVCVDSSGLMQMNKMNDPEMLSAAKLLRRGLIIHSFIAIYCRAHYVECRIRGAGNSRQVVSH